MLCRGGVKEWRILGTQWLVVCVRVCVCVCVCVLLQNIEEKHALRVQLEGTVEELWGQFQQALRSYNEATEDRHVSFDALRTRDHKSAQEIDMQMRRLQKMQVRKITHFVLYHVCVCVCVCGRGGSDGIRGVCHSVLVCSS